MKYLGVIYNQRDSLCHRAEESFNHLFDQSPQMMSLSKLTLYYINDSQHINLIKGKNSVFLGSIYNKESYRKVTPNDLNINLTENELNNRFYGGFLAFILEQNSMIIFRDITGKVQLFYARLDNGNIVFSNSLAQLNYYISKKQTIDEYYLCSYLLHERVSDGKTFLKNVSELPSGCSLKISNNNIKINLHWDPEKISFNKIKKHDIAFLMENVISSHIEPFERIVLNFSGGLDSTSILYSLLSSVKNHKNIELVNYYNEGFKSVNETEHAKKIASDLNIDLIEKAVDLSNFFKYPDISGLKSLPNIPSPLLISWNHEQNMNKYFDKGDKHILINGFAGDQIFMQSPSIYSLADAYFDHGYKKLLQVAMNLCQIKRQTCVNLYIKNVIGVIKKLLLKNHYKDSSFFIPDWATKELIKKSNYYPSHPIYYKSVKRFGKDDHIYSIKSAIEYANTVNTEISKNVFHPFLQQPLIELALSFPSYDLFDEEYTRIPIRKSIHNYYNTNYVWRKDKGESTGVMLKIILNNYKYITSVCCDGFFGENKLIKKDIVVSHIQSLASGQPYNIWPFIRLFSTEMFLNLWKNYSPQIFL